jgi:hypothetical protein
VRSYDPRSTMNFYSPYYPLDLAPSSTIIITGNSIPLVAFLAHGVGSGVSGEIFVLLNMMWFWWMRVGQELIRSWSCGDKL